MVTRAGANAAASAVSCERSQNAGITVFACVARTIATVSDSRGCTFQRMNCARPLLTRRSAGVVGLHVAGEHESPARTCAPIAPNSRAVAPDVPSAEPASMMPRAPSIGFDGYGEPFDFVTDTVAQRNAGAVASCRSAACMASSTKMSVRPWRSSASAISGPRPLAGTGSSSGPRSTNGASLPQHSGERRVVAAVGAIHQHRARRRRRIVGVKHQFRRKVAGVEQAVADGEAQPDAARRVAVAAGLDRDAEHLAAAANRQRPPGDAIGQSRADDFGGIDRRIAEFRQQRQPADMVLVAVAEHQRVDRANIVDLGQQPRRRALAEIEHQPLARRFDAGSRPAPWRRRRRSRPQSGFWAHRIRPIFQCAMGGGEN